MANPLQTLARLFVPQPIEELEQRSIGDFPTLSQQMHEVIWRRWAQRPWRPSSIREILGVPAVFRCVSLIANTVGSLSMNAYRLGAQLAPDDRPKLIVKPNPYTTPRDFYRDTAFYLSTRGEAWWWVMARDNDGNAISLYPVPPWEVSVERNPRNRLLPTIKWLDKEIPREDMRHITYQPAEDGLRGMGPLQACGAAMSVTVEAQEWAANFFTGSTPSIVGTTDLDLDATEMALLDEQWAAKPSNLPRWVTNGFKVQDFTIDPSKAQLTDARTFQVGEIVRALGVPGALVEFSAPGSSLTYQNVSQVFDMFVKACLIPNYLQPVEQAMSDLLTRSTVAEFNVTGLLRADIKTRFEVYESAITKSQVLTIDEARQMEGLAPGDVERAPVAPAPPQAIATMLPFEERANSPREVRCSNHHLLAELASPPYRFTCFRCKETVAA